MRRWVNPDDIDESDDVWVHGRIVDQRILREELEKQEREERERERERDSRVA